MYTYECSCVLSVAVPRNYGRGTEDNSRETGKPTLSRKESQAPTRVRPFIEVDQKDTVSIVYSDISYSDTVSSLLLPVTLFLISIGVSIKGRDCTHFLLNDGATRDSRAGAIASQCRPDEFRRRRPGVAVTAPSNLSLSSSFSLQYMQYLL